MSFLVKGVELPSNCHICPFLFWDKPNHTVWCVVNQKDWMDISNVPSRNRAMGCPLIEIKDDEP